MEIKIEKNVPIPKPRMTGLTEGVRSLQIGDSFIVEGRDQLVNLWVTSKRLGIKITTRTTEEGIRVWRIE